MRTILTIDDQKDNLTTIEALLKNHLDDCELLTAMSGEEGIARAQKEQPDVILLDIIMPKMDGYEVCKKLKADKLTKHIPIVMVTAIKTDVESRVKGLEFGADAFLYKPIDATELSAQVKAMLRIKEAEDKLRAEKEDLEKLIEKRSSEIVKNNKKLRLEINERKKAENQLRLSEKKHRTQQAFLEMLINTIPNPVFYKDKQGKYVGVNSAFTNFIGISAKNVIGKSVFDISPKNIAEEYWKKDNELLKNPGTQHYEWKAKNKDGEIRDVIFDKASFTDTFGEVGGLVGIITDITERKIAENELLKNQYYLKKAQEIGSIGTWELDLQRNILMWTEENYKIFGVPLDTPVNFELFLKCVHPEDREYVSKAWADGINTKKYDIEHRAIVNGEVKWIREKAEFELDKKGNPVMAIGFSQDISSQKMADNLILQSEIRYRELVETINSGVAVYKVINDGNSGSDYIIQDFNKTALKIEGMRKEEVIGKSLLDIRPTIDEYGLIPIFKKVWKSGEAAYYPAKEYKDNKYSNYYENRVFRLPNGEIVAVYDDVTARENASLLIKESQERYDLAVNATQDGIFDWNLITNEIYYTPSWKNMLGYTDDELPNDFSIWETLTKPEDVKKSWEMLQEVIDKKRDRFEMEFKMKHKDGHWVDIHSRANAILDKKGKAVRMIGTHIDITERKMVEKKSKEQDKEKSAMLKGMLNAFVIFESVFDENNQFVSYRFQYINDAYEKITGVKNEEVFGKTVHEVWPDTEPEWIKRYGEVATSGESQSFELYHDPTKKHYHCNVYRPFETNEKFCVIFEDVTERKHAEEQIRLITQRLQLSTESAGIGIWDLNLKNNILIWDKRMFELYGIEEADFEGAYEAWIAGVHPDDIVQADKEVQDAINGKKDFHSIFRILWPSGEVRYIEAYAMVQTDNDGAPERMIGVNWDISERKKAEIELNESETKYRTLIENSIQGVVIAQSDPVRLSFASSAMADISGFTVSELTSMNPETLAKLIHPDDRQRFFTNFQKRLGGENFERQSEYKIVDKSGAIKWVLVFSSRIKYQGEDAAIATFLDVTDRRLAEQTLVESEEKYRSLMENLPVGIFRSTYEGIGISANQAMADIYGYQSVEELLSVPTSDFYTSEYPREDNISILEVEGSLLGHETLERKKDGSLVWVSVNYRASFDEKGKIKYIDGVINDITERKKAEVSLRESEEKHRTILKTASDGFWLVDVNGHLIEVNDSYSRMSGYSEEELLQMSISDLEVLESKDEIIQRIKKIIKVGEARFETKHLRKDGSHFDVEASVQYQNTDGGRFVCFMHDITERKIADQKLLNALEKAKESDRLKSAFLATMSHELRTPLNAIIGFSDIINKDVPLEDILKFNETINTSGIHLLHIVEDIFDITLIEEGQLNIIKEKVQLSSLMNNILEVMKLEQGKTNKVHLDFNLIVPNEGKDLVIHTDGSKLKQILINLLKNALKFTHQGYVHYGFEIETIKNKTNLKFFIEDTGIGIPKDKWEIIFDHFRQVEETHTKTFGGAGIGLSIAKKLTKLLSGDIWLNSELGKGSTFYFTIPLEESDMASIKIQPKKEISGKSATIKQINEKDKTILVVEDDENSFEFLKVILEKSGANTLWSKNGEEAIEQCKQNPKIDLVLMDINMPIMNGYEATREIKKLRPNLPIIAQTAYAMAGDQEKSLEAGCDDYITKPIKQEVLITKIEELLSI